LGVPPHPARYHLKMLYRSSTPHIYRIFLARRSAAVGWLELPPATATRLPGTYDQAQRVREASSRRAAPCGLSKSNRPTRQQARLRLAIRQGMTFIIFASASSAARRPTCRPIAFDRPHDGGGGATPLATLGRRLAARRPRDEQECSRCRCPAPCQLQRGLFTTTTRARSRGGSGGAASGYALTPPRVGSVPLFQMHAAKKKSDAAPGGSAMSAWVADVRPRRTDVRPRLG